MCNFWGVFQKIGQNGRPGGREPSRSTSFDETSRLESVWGRKRKIIFCNFVGVFFQKIGGLSKDAGRHRLRHAKMLRVHGFKPIFGVFGVFFQKIGQNGRPGGREPPRSTSFDETSRIKSVWGRTRKNVFEFFFVVFASLIFWTFFQKSVKTGV